MKIYQIKLKDGGVFRVLCENTTQEKKLGELINKNEDKIIKDGTVYIPVLNGISTLKNFRDNINIR